MNRVLITGASSGIGEALAVSYAKRGARLVLFARREEELGRVAAECGKYCGPGSVRITVGDVRSEHDLRRAVGEATVAFGGLDTLIANAGFGVTGRFEDLSIEDYQRQFETNLWGVMNTIRAGLAEIRKTNGRIVLMGSVMSYFSASGQSPYCMSKFAVRALADSLRLELGPLGVSVTLVCPGLIRSHIRQVDNAGAFHRDSKDPVPDWIVMSAATAARKIIAGIEARKGEVIVTFHGKLIIALVRFCPWVLPMIDRALQPEESRSA